MSIIATIFGLGLTGYCVAIRRKKKKADAKPMPPKSKSDQQSDEIFARCAENDDEIMPQTDGETLPTGSMSC